MQKAYHNRLDLTLTNPFSDRNGEIISYSIVVASERHNPANRNISLPSWANIQGQDQGTAYFAVHKCPDLLTGDHKCQRDKDNRQKRETQGSKTAVMFTVGGDGNCRITDNFYCNGPLQPETQYYIAVGGYTENGLYTMGPMSEPFKTTASRFLTS